LQATDCPNPVQNPKEIYTTLVLWYLTKKGLHRLLRERKFLNTFSEFCSALFRVETGIIR